MIIEILNIQFMGSASDYSIATNYTIATLGSHTALQILKGARDEGFRTICICEKGKREPYDSYKVADEIIEIEKFSDFFQIEPELKKQNAILIPHGSFVSYIGVKEMQKVSVMHFGMRSILAWESDRVKQRDWLMRAGLRQPHVFEKPEDIDRAVIVKFHGALGGSGYFIANTPAEFYEHIREYNGDRRYVIQEYIVGVPMYIHYFYSPLNDELEIMSFDKRYESNADSIGRIAARDQLEVHLKTSYMITGNIPVVVRESLLPQLFAMGRSVVETSRSLEGVGQRGLFGPFCLEMIIDPKLNFYTFEISARIVAGTNPYVNGSPYTWLRYNESMSTGRRIAREIRNGIEGGKLAEVLG